MRLLPGPSVILSLPIVSLIHFASVPLVSFLFLRYGRCATWNSCFSDKRGLLLHFFLLHLCFCYQQHKTVPTPLLSLLFNPLHCCTHIDTHFYYPTIFLLKIFKFIKKTCKNSQPASTFHLVLPTSVCISQEQGHSLKKKKSQ